MIWHYVQGSWKPIQPVGGCNRDREAVGDCAKADPPCFPAYSGSRTLVYPILEVLVKRYAERAQRLGISPRPQPLRFVVNIHYYVYVLTCIMDQNCRRPAFFS